MCLFGDVAIVVSVESMKAVGVNISCVGVIVVESMEAVVVVVSCGDVDALVEVVAVVVVVLCQQSPSPLLYNTVFLYVSIKSTSKD